MSARTRLGSMVRRDVELQYRYGFYAVYVVLIALFVLALRQVPEASLVLALVVVLFGDQGFLGFYFVGSLVLFEKREGVLDALVTSPLRPREYLLSKVLSLTALALVASTTITALTYGTGFDPLFFLLAMVLTSALFVFVGFIAVSRFDSINAYFLTALAYTLPLGAPLVDFFGLVTHPLLYLLPSQASIVLLEAAFGPVPASELAYGVGYLGLWCVAAYWFAERAFVRDVVEGRGGGVGPDRRGSDVDGSGLLTSSRFGPIGTLTLSDLTNWVRDPLLIYIALSPLLLALLGRWGMPALAAALPSLPVASYYPLVVVAGFLTPPATFGFVAGFFVLDERDSGVLTALRLTPLTGRGYLLYRGLTAVVLSFLGSVAVVPILGLASVPVEVLLPASAVAALWAPVVGLILVSNASNTVEGVAISKVLGLLVTVPLVAIALLSEPWQYLAGVFPAYWPAKALLVALDTGANPWLLLLAGVLVHTAAIGVLLRRFARRVQS